MHDCCNQGRAMIEGSQVPLPLFCSFYFRTSKQGQILYRIIEGIIIIFGPLSHFCSPSPTFCSPSPTFGSSSPTFGSPSHFMLILASSVESEFQTRISCLVKWLMKIYSLSSVWSSSSSSLRVPVASWMRYFRFFTAYLIASWAS